MALALKIEDFRLAQPQVELARVLDQLFLDRLERLVILFLREIAVEVDRSLCVMNRSSLHLLHPPPRCLPGLVDALPQSLWRNVYQLAVDDQGLPGHHDVADHLRTASEIRSATPGRRPARPTTRQAQPRRRHQPSHSRGFRSRLPGERAAAPSRVAIPNTAHGSRNSRAVAQTVDGCREAHFVEDRQPIVARRTVRAEYHPGPRPASRPGTSAIPEPSLRLAPGQWQIVSPGVGQAPNIGPHRGGCRAPGSRRLPTRPWLSRNSMLPKAAESADLFDLVTGSRPRGSAAAIRVRGRARRSRARGPVSTRGRSEGATA